MANPVLNVKLTGDSILTRLDRSVSWEHSEKVEDDVQIINSDTISIDYSYVDNIRLILFEGDGDYKVSITASGSTIEFECRDLFVFSPTSTFMSTITNIELSTSSVTAVKVKIRLYGEVVS